MANISQKVNLTANQRMDIAEFMAIQTNLENAVTRLVQLIGSPIVDPVTNIQWNVNGVLTPSSITVSGSDLVIGSGLEVMCKDGHIITQDANYTMTGVLPLGATKALMAKPLAETPALPDNRRFWDNSVPQEVNSTPNTILTRQLDFAFVPNTAADIEDAVNNGDYVFIATVSSDGSTVVWKNAFPDSGTLELPSLLAIVKRLIGDGNENSGSRSISLGGYSNTNSGTDSASSGGFNNTNSGDLSASSGGYGNTNSGTGSASSGGFNNTNSGAYSASSGGYRNTNSGYGSASSGGWENTNSGDDSASSGGWGNTNSGNYSASSGGYSNTNSGTRSASCGGWGNTNSGYSSASSGGRDNTNGGDYSASSGGWDNTNSGNDSASLGGQGNTNSGNDSASIGGLFNTNLAAAIRGITLGGQYNTNGGLQSVVLGQYCENATDDVICGGYNTTLTPSGANQNLKWILSNRYGTAHFASDVKVGGNVNDGTGSLFRIYNTGSFQTEANAYFGGDIEAVTDPLVKIIGATGKAYFGGDIEIGGTVTAGTGASTAPTVVIAASSGNVHAEGDVKIGGDATAGTNVKFQVTGATGRIQTEGDVEIGGDADVGTDWKASIAASSGAAYVSEVNVGAGAGATTGMKAQIDANGTIAHLGSYHAKQTVATGKTVDIDGSGSYVTNTGISLVDTPINSATIVASNAAVGGGSKNLVHGDVIWMALTDNSVVITGGYVKVFAASTTGLAQTTWSVSSILDASNGSTYVALAYTGKNTVAIADGGTETLTLVVYLNTMKIITSI